MHLFDVGNAQIIHILYVNVAQKNTDGFVLIKHCTIFYFFLQISLDKSKKVTIIGGVGRTYEVI